MFQFSIWRRIPLRIQGLIFNSLPLIAVLLTAGFAFISNQQREKMEMSVNRHFEMVENLVDIQSQLLTAVAALRAYRLSGDAKDLLPCQETLDVVPAKLERVAILIGSISKPNHRTEKQEAFAAVRAPVEAQMQALSVLLPDPAHPERSVVDRNAPILLDQSALQQASEQIDQLRAGEEHRLGKRLDEIRSVRQRDFLLIFLSIAIGLASRVVALYFFHRRVVRRVRQLTENARSLRDGADLVHVPSDHPDDIGELERELARIGDYLAERRINPLS